MPRAPRPATSSPPSAVLSGEARISSELRAAQRLGAGHPHAARSVAMAKYHTALAAGRIAAGAVQIFGGSGLMEESAVARHYRDVRILRIGGGADEIQLEILSRELAPRRRRPGDHDR